AVMAGPSFEVPSIFLPHEKKRNRSHTGAGSQPQLPDFLGAREDDYIGPAERRGPHNMKALTEATGVVSLPPGMKKTCRESFGRSGWLCATDTSSRTNQ